MTARCERCEKDVEYIWQYAEAADTGWLCSALSSSPERDTCQLNPGTATATLNLDLAASFHVNPATT